MLSIPVEMQPHQARVVQERLRLSEDVNKLETFVRSEAFAAVAADEQELLNEQLEHMARYLGVLQERVLKYSGVKRYTCRKSVLARAMNRASYNLLRGWELPANENGDDEGFLIEDTDGGPTNHPDFPGYISWIPKDLFERTYREKA